MRCGTPRFDRHNSTSGNASNDGLARRIVVALGGDWHGSGGNVPGLGHSRRDRSVSIAPHPADPKDVLVYCHAGDDPFAFKAELRRRGLLPPRGTNRQPHWPRPAAIARRARPEPAAWQTRNRELAARKWREAHARLEGTAAGVYLTEARGLPGPWPPSLRFHSCCPRGKGEPALPALVAAVTVPTTSEFRAIHRIFLRPDGRDKADLPREQQKRSLGPSAGAAVVLDDLTASDGPILEGEGLETTLTVAQALGLAGIASLSAGTLGRAPLPPGRAVIILADRGGEAAARKAASLRLAEGREVRIALPPEGCKDFNDAVRGGRGHAPR